MNQKDPDPDSQKETEQEKSFRAEVEAALLEADDPATEWFPEDVVEKEMDELKAELEALVAARRKK